MTAVDIIGDAVPISRSAVGDIVEVEGVRMHVIARLEGQGVTVVDPSTGVQHRIPWRALCRATGERWLD